MEKKKPLIYNLLFKQINKIPLVKSNIDTVL